MPQPKKVAPARQLNFETLLLDISARFINLPAERIDEAIETAQQHICECLGFDMSDLWQWSETDPGMLELSHLCSPPDGPERPMKIDGTQAFPWAYRKMLAGETLQDTLDNGTKTEAEYRIMTQPEGQKWVLSRGCPSFNSHGSVYRILGVSIDISDRKKMEQDLNNRLTEIDSLKQKLEKENRYLRKKLSGEKGFENIIGHSKALRLVLHAARQVAPTEATVLLQGETGTGKGLFARAIHRVSDRSEHPFVTVNCAALPHYLIESELFGHEKGAFTGAHSQKPGRFEVAESGTLFLDEIGDLPLELQTKLLRVLQDGEFERLGSSKPIKVRARIVAATSRNLQDEVEAGRFRQELYYRVNVFPIIIPPLRQRDDDKLLLVHHFINSFSRKMNKTIEHIPKATLDDLCAYEWPGNVREMEHFIERGVILSSENTFAINDQLQLPSTSQRSHRAVKNLKALERDHIIHAPSLTGWKINGSDGAAELLDIHPSTLRFRMKKLGIERPDENASNHRNVVELR